LHWRYITEIILIMHMILKAEQNDNVSKDDEEVEDDFEEDIEDDIEEDTEDDVEEEVRNE
ncbi:MAG: hypothetical protein ACRD7F_07785, partial [Nitrososphaeraceae archaeon]